MRIKYPKLRELKEAVKALVKGPYTSRFPYQPHVPFERFRGKTQFHQDDCMGCGACYEVCPSRAIDMEDVKDRRILTVHWDLCIFCGQCQANCPTEKGIMLSNEFDLSTTESRNVLFQSIEKELVICEGCNEVIAPHDQIIWVAKKIGPLAFSNASVMLFYLKELSVANVDLELLKEKPAFLRSDRISILCPKCRREAVLKS